ncbi:branched-chain amino acid ABC transporter permease [Pseudoxanthobacter sp. M-2]|uniref:branched-chain amino acid ABC transporter permease n=1 Tax=Pseudoxanthobacter sp. M-2 TaxID=3078754 RepID=UPI0038FC36DC
MASYASLTATKAGAGESDTLVSWRVFILLAVLLAFAPIVVYPIFVLKVLCFALFASAVNLLLGFGGLLSFGHAAYFGIAAYATAYFAKTFQLTPEIAILVGVAGSAALAAVFGLVAIRRQGVFFAMITLALAQMLYFVFLQSSFTGGEDGIQAVPRGYLFGLIDLRDTTALYVFIATVFLLAILFLHRIVHSPFGQVIKAIRDNEPRAISMGYDAQRFKYLLFILSGALAGLAGSMKTIVFQLATLSDVHWSTSGAVVLMVLIGGMGTILGPIAGALIVVAIENYLAHLGAWVTFVQGWIFIAAVLLFRRGAIGELASRLKIRL